MSATDAKRSPVASRRPFNNATAPDDDHRQTNQATPSRPQRSAMFEAAYQCGFANGVPGFDDLSDEEKERMTDTVVRIRRAHERKRLNGDVV